MTDVLRFTVERVLAGETDVLKESVIATEALGKPVDFDPRLDPAVRVVAGRLRKRLKEYYDSDGKLDPLIIQFPSSGYVPSFSLRQISQSGGLKPPEWQTGKYVAIATLARVAIAFIGAIVIKQRPNVDINGRWIAEMRLPGQRPFRVVFDLKVARSDVTGVVMYPRGNGLIVAGKIAGRRLSFQVPFTDDPSKPSVTTSYYGEVRDDGIHLFGDDLYGRVEGVARRSPP